MFQTSCAKPLGESCTRLFAALSSLSIEPLKILCDKRCYAIEKNVPIDLC